MLTLFRKFKNKKRDPILEMIEKQTNELSEINKSRIKDRELVEQEITKSENMLRELGYSDEDINKLKFKVLK